MGKKDNQQSAKTEDDKKNTGNNEDNNEDDKEDMIDEKDGSANKNKSRHNTDKKNQYSVNHKEDYEEVEVKIEDGYDDGNGDDKENNEDDNDEEKKDKKEKATAIASSTKRQKKRAMAFPTLMEGLSYSLYSDIDKNMKSGALNCMRKDETELEVQFPFSASCFTKEHILQLNRDPLTTTDKTDLLAGTAILDLATQWTFMDTDPITNTNQEEIWSPLPATTFFSMLLSGSYKKCNLLAKTIELNPNANGMDLFSYKVLDLVVHHDRHYSRIFILNLKLVLDKTSKYSKDTDDHIACMFHVNSLPTFKSKLHDPEHCAVKVRTFLNQYGKDHNPRFRNVFNKNSLPVYQIKSKCCCCVIRCAQSVIVFSLTYTRHSSSLSRGQVVVWLPNTLRQTPLYETNGSEGKYYSWRCR